MRKIPIKRLEKKSNKKVDQGAQAASSNKTDKPSENLEVKSDEASVEEKTGD